MRSKMSISLKKSPSRKLYFLHGFLGDPSDWDEVMAELPKFSCTALSFPFVLPKEGILVGYSMGGRAILSSPLPKIVIAGHPGLQSESEKKARLRQEEEWIEKLQTQSFDDFLNDWYSQPLFSTLDRQQMIEKRRKQDPKRAIEQIDVYSLAKQPFQIPPLTTFVYGEKDQKFKELYQALSIPALKIENAGHACHLENPKRVAEIIQTLVQLSRPDKGE